MGEQLYFIVDQGIGFPSDPWRSDGSVAGTGRQRTIGHYATSMTSCFGEICWLVVTSNGSLECARFDGQRKIVLDIVSGQEGWLVTACVGSNARPRLWASDPVMGQRMEVRARDLTPGRSGLLVMTPPRVRPTPLLSTRCLAYGDWTRAVVLQRFAVTSRMWSTSFRIPNLPAADRVQAILRLVAAPSDGPIYGDLSNAVRLAFGD